MTAAATPDRPAATATPATVDDYRIRFGRVLAHVEANTDGDLRVERLSGVAAYSKFHFHRQFAALYGIGVYKYVQLVRLRRAAYQLAFREGERVIDVALGAGYESPEAFARAFKKLVGQAPSEFRERPAWTAWHTAQRQLAEIRSRHMKPAPQLADVRIVDFPETRVGAFEHRGAPARIGDSVRAFIGWRKQNHLPPTTSATFNILHDDPTTTPPDAYRLDICAATDRPIAPNTEGVVAKTIPAGRCAVLRHVGSDDTLGDSLRFLYATWLPQSGEEPRDFPLFLQRVRFFPDVPENESVLDIFLPLR